MMKRMFFICISMIILLSITSCSNDDEVAKELIDYYNNDWITVQKMKQEKLGSKKIELLRQIEIGDESANTYAKEEIIPSMKEILDYLHGIKLDHKEVQKLHQLQVEADEFFYEGLKDFPAHYRGEINDKEIQEKEDKLKEKYDEVLDYQEKLMEKYDLKYDQAKGKVDGFYELKNREDLKDKIYSIIGIN
ncbi:hypothetical protein WMZ97_11920 [Lentibacillus sp. N15]|uniref:hypothetical protein n=1 Tax=Lentibacillus songyuanensis TaxID=3136161 RepID=UPI0031B9D13E